MAAPERLTPLAARRLAVAAHGFARARPRGIVTAAHVRRTVQALGLVQIDYVNILAPAHQTVLFSRLGPYDTALIDRLLFRRRELYEHWAHAASILPVDAWPLLAHRMEPGDRRAQYYAEFRRRRGAYVDFVWNEIRTRGALGASDLPEPDGAQRGRREAWWGWSAAKIALEVLLASGHVAIAGRRTAGSERVYDLTERVIPSAHPLPRADAQRELVRRAARACGVATIADLADYFRMLQSDTRRRVAELVRAGELREVRIDGWREAAYVWTAAPRPRRVEAAALLSPFDPVVWYRPRALRLYDFDYRIEIYTPAAKRRFGYYVLPFLLGDRIVARVDLKADRAAGVLRVLAAHREAHADGRAVTTPLARELRVVAQWLALDDVHVSRRGDLATALAKAV